MPEKIDLFKQLKREDYKAPKNPEFVTVKKGKYLAIEGRGAPDGEEFSAKIGAVYSVAYTVKMTRKYNGGQDYVVGKLEAQWWGDDGSDDFSNLPADNWRYRLMMRTPDFVGTDELEKAIAALLEKGKDPAIKEVALVEDHEGDCVQMLHVGPYNQESATIEKMKAYAKDRGRAFGGRHHEIYISDPRRVPPERLKTILRMPLD